MNTFFFGMIWQSIGDLCYYFDMNLVHQIFGAEKWYISRQVGQGHLWSLRFAIVALKLVDTIKY
jgi:hypothetical protein